MSITLQPVTRDNYERVCQLRVAEDQEDFVADNAWSLVESIFEPGCETRAICRDGQPVGFFMWVRGPEARVTIWRFMVDEGHQRQGIGTAALRLAIAEIGRSAGVREIGIYYDPRNPVAKDFYARFGFVEIDPVETDPAKTGPAETGPAETDPAETDPAETDPAKPEEWDQDEDDSDRLAILTL